MFLKTNLLPLLFFYTAINHTIFTQDLKDYPRKNYLINNHTTFYVNPIDLISPWRIDVMAKYIYAKHRKLKIKSRWAYNLYAQHLKVWNNQKEVSPRKNNLKEYIATFHKMLNSIDTSGFQPNKSIVPIDERGLLINGSHRTASCLLYNKQVMCKVDHKNSAGIATTEYFKNRKQYVKSGLDEKYLDNMVLQYCNLKKNTYIGILFPVAIGKDKQATQIIESCGRIIYTKNVYLYNQGPLNLIKHSYLTKSYLNGIEDNFSAAKKAAKIRFPEGKGRIRIFIFQAKDLKTVQTCKKKIRTLYGIGNFSIHMNDTHEELLILARALLNKNSIHFLNYGHQRAFKKFNKLLNTYKNWLHKNNVDEDCFCVDGSAVLSVYGIGEAPDLDFVHHGYNEMAQSTGSKDISSHNSELYHHVLGLDDIIFNPNNHFYYKGIKFASLQVVKKMKQKRNKPKDLVDIKLIENHALSS